MQVLVVKLWKVHFSLLFIHDEGKELCMYICGMLSLIVKKNKKNSLVVYWNTHLISNLVKNLNGPYPCGYYSMNICLDISSKFQTIWPAEVLVFLELGLLSHCKGAGFTSTQLLQTSPSRNAFSVVTSFTIKCVVFTQYRHTEVWVVMFSKKVNSSSNSRSNLDPSKHRLHKPLSVSEALCLFWWRLLLSFFICHVFM